MLLDHRPEFTAPHPDHRPKKGLRVVLPEHPHHGFPDPSGEGFLPMETFRLLRDGWRLIQRIQFDRSGRWFRLVQPWILERAGPDGDRVLVMRDDHSYVWGGKGRLYYLRDRATGEEVPLEGVQWADWDHAGRLVFSRGGALLALSPGQPVEEAKLRADFTSQTFESIAPPDWATHW